jgi:hypothetical protein
MQDDTQNFDNISTLIRKCFSMSTKLKKTLSKRIQELRHAQFRTTSKIKSIMGLPNPKIFCIGRNKTGTTSLQSALIQLGYRVGVQRDAELLVEEWGKRNFQKLIQYCHTADAFQDVPFSYHYTFQAMDTAFPESKFILSVRDSDEQWYQSVVRFHTMRLEQRIGFRRAPTLEDIKQDPYIKPGWIWRNRELTGIVGVEAFPEGPLKHYYNRHNEIVVDYFRNRPGDLLVLNLSENDSMQHLCEFLGKPYCGQEMPILNQST